MISTVIINNLNNQPMLTQFHQFTCKNLSTMYVKPCSYEACVVVLRNIGRKVGIKQYGGDRSWVIVVCDGVPYNLCSRIIRCYFICSECHSSVAGEDSCAKHNREEQPNVEHVSFAFEFDWVLLRPGPGHIEINMVKAFVDLTWNVFFRELAITMNFRSEMALKYAQKVSDHHKGWTLCRIARESVCRELVVPFVHEKLEVGQQNLTAKEFFEYVMCAQDPNYAFMCDILFEILDAVFMYRGGIRCNIKEFIEAGQAKFAKMWCGRWHPLYRELEVCDLVQQLRMPADVRQLVDTSTSINLKGTHGTGEGADFRLEEVNRQVQNWLPNIPSAEDWKIACCNFDDLVKFRSCVFKEMGVQDPKMQPGSRKPQDITEEVRAFRTKLRKAKYLLNPAEKKQHVSLDGKPLDQELKNFCKLAREKRARYSDIFLTHENTARLYKPRPPSYKEHPVFVTLEERKKYTAIENLTIAAIRSEIEKGIQTLHDSDLRESLTQSWHDIAKTKRTQKAVILDFYHELRGYIECQAPMMDGIDDAVEEQT